MSAVFKTFKPSGVQGQTAMARARVRMSEVTGLEINNVMDEIRLTQQGISVSVYESIKSLGASTSELGWIIKPRTLTHRKDKQESLTQEESGRWLRAAKVQALALEVFGDQEKAVIWLHKPRKRFDGQPASFLIQTEVGAQLVEDTLNQIDAGYFA